MVSKAICTPFGVSAYVGAETPVTGVSKPTVRVPFGNLPALLEPPPALELPPELFPPDELHAASNATDARMATLAFSLALLIRCALSLRVGGMHVDHVQNG
jgi:hypothetical protein